MISPPDSLMMMRGLFSAVILGSSAIALSSSGYAACNVGDGVCEPSVDEARAKVEQLLNSAFLPPYSLSVLEKLDGRSFETQGHKKYEMRILAVVIYSGDALQCRIKLCPELHNYLVEVDKVERKAKIAGWLFFEQEGTEWR